MKENLGRDFESFAKSKGISGLNLHNFSNSMTPYILEERSMNVTQMDVFSRLMKDRIIFLGTDVNSHVSSIITAQLLFLETLDKSSDINMYVNTPGGSVSDGLMVKDTMDYINPDVATTNMGIAASMGSIILSSGAKGKRSALISSKVMTHQVSHGTQGNVQDTRVNQYQAEMYNYMLFKTLAMNSSKSFEDILERSRRDMWFNSDEALDYGFIDEIIGLDKSPSITTLMEGYDEYYQREVLGRK